MLFINKYYEYPLKQEVNFITINSGVTQRLKMATIKVNKEF